MSLFSQDDRIFSVQNILLVYNLPNSILGIHPICCAIVCHCAMLLKLVPLNLMVFGVTFHVRSLHLTFRFNKTLSHKYRSILTVTEYTDSMIYTAVSYLH